MLCWAGSLLFGALEAFFKVGGLWPTSDGLAVAAGDEEKAFAVVVARRSRHALSSLLGRPGSRAWPRWLQEGRACFAFCRLRVRYQELLLQRFTERSPGRPRGEMVCRGGAGDAQSRRYTAAASWCEPLGDQRPQLRICMTFSNGDSCLPCLAAQQQMTHGQEALPVTTRVWPPAVGCLWWVQSGWRAGGRPACPSF